MKTKLLKQAEYEQFAHLIMPPDWKFVWVKFIQKDGEDANGICKHDEKTVKIVWSKRLFHEDLVRTIIHESVHVMLGKDKLGHDKEFWSLYESVLKINSHFIYQYTKPTIDKDTKQLYLYHGTSSKHIKKILKEGITPRKDKKGNWELVSRQGHVYLTIAYPIYFAINACNLKKDKPVVVKIQLDKADFKFLYPDEDFIGQVLVRQHKDLFKGTSLGDITNAVDLEYYKKYWVKSLIGLGNVSHKGIITPDKIVDWCCVEDKMLLMAGGDPSISVLNFYFCGDRYIGITNSLFNNNILGENHGKS